jgi:ectoine hydroxylase-related dioxygenase (phytanoyl-CoA dioxygenase family)
LANPDNYDDEMGLHHFGPDADVVSVAAHLRTYGYAIVDDLANGALLDQLDREARDYIAHSAHGRDIYDGKHTRRTGALIARCPASRELVMNPTVVSVVRNFLDHVTAVQLHLTQLISIEPGETAQKLHRDQMAFDFYPFPPTYHVQCNTMWALTDFTTENGATHVVPGTSAVSDAAVASLPEYQAEMKRGSVLFYDGKVIHGGGANRSSTVRRGVNITYAVGWVRQEENQYLACPPEIATTLDDELLRMMGYQQGAFALGYVGDQQDALANLRGIDRKVKVIGEIAEQNANAAEFVTDLKESQ